MHSPCTSAEEMRLLPRLPDATTVLFQVPPTAASIMALTVPAICFDLCNLAYLGYQTRALNYAPECLGPDDPDEPLGKYFEQCFSCLAANHLDPVAYLGGFGELLAYCSTETSCQEGSSPCNDIGLAGAGMCCPANQYCVLNSTTSTKGDCCTLGSDCGSPCNASQYPCNITTTVTDAVVMTATTVIPTCCWRATTRLARPRSNTIPSSGYITSLVTPLTVTISGTGLDGTSTLTTLTVLVSERLIPQVPDATGDASSDRGGGGPDWARAWIAGPILGALVLLAIVLGVYFFIRRRRRRAQAQDEAWAGTTEVNTESLPGGGGGDLPPELDASGVPELDSTPRARGPMAEMGANEVAAREVDVLGQHQEMDASPTGSGTGKAFEKGSEVMVLEMDVNRDHQEMDAASSPISIEREAEGNDQ